MPTLLINYAIAFLALVAVSSYALVLLVGPVDASAGYCSEGRYMGCAVVDHHCEERDPTCLPFSLLVCVLLSVLPSSGIYLPFKYVS